MALLRPVSIPRVHLNAPQPHETLGGEGKPHTQPAYQVGGHIEALHGGEDGNLTRQDPEGLRRASFVSLGPESVQHAKVVCNSECVRGLFDAIPLPGSDFENLVSGQPLVNRRIAENHALSPW